MTCCWAFSIRRWSNSSSRFPPLATATTPQSISRSTLAASFPCMYKAGSGETKKIMPVGQDGLDWKKIFTAAKTGGVRNYFVEMNLEMMKASVPYLRDLQV